MSIAIILPSLIICPATCDQLPGKDPKSNKFVFIFIKLYFLLSSNNLNEALERWLNQKNTLPERVSDLVAEQFLPMLPMAPEGKVFVIDSENRRVILIAEK